MEWLDRRNHRKTGTYLVAVGATMLVGGIRFLLHGELDNVSPFLPFVLAVCVAAFHGGLRPGLLATGLSAMTALFFFTPPLFTPWGHTFAEGAGLVLFVVIGGSISWMCGGMHRARQQIESQNARLQIEVSERVKAEQAERDQREQLRTTLASIGDAVIATDIESRITNMNAVAESLTGWTNSGAKGQPLDTVFRIVNEQNRDPVENPVEKVLREGGIVGLANHTVLIAKDGTERPIDDSAAPIWDAADKMSGVVLTFRDVTEQRKAERELRASDARKSAVLEAALDCIITMDHQGKVVDFNPAAEQTFGYSHGDAIGRELADLIIPLSLRERHRRGMAHYLATGEGPVLGKRIEAPALRADGSEFLVELAITRIVTDGPPLFTAYLRDISERSRAEQYRNARLGVTQALNEASDVGEGAIRVLRTVCESLSWDVGFFWIVKKSGDGLECRQTWHNPEVSVTEFEAASFNRTFEKGEGLPGHVWSTGQPHWVIDVARDANFPRAASAAAHDLHSAFACPVVVGGRVIGVIEFFTRHLREPDADLLEMMGTVAGNVGQFIERQSVEQELRQSEAELADFFENATVGLHWVGADGIILRANRAECDMLGYSRDEYVGRPITDFHADEDVIRDILARLKTGEKLNEYPARLRCRDGSIKDVLIDSSVLWNNGAFVHTRCFTRDITERKAAELLLRQSEERFRSLMDQAPFSIQVFSPDGRTSLVNRAWENLWGVPLCKIGDYNILEDRQLEAKGALSFIQQAFAGEPIFVPAIQYDPNETIPDLTKHADPVRWVTAVAYPLKNDAGRVREVVLVHQDITAQRNAEAALRESEEKLRLLADTIPQLAWMARPDGHIFWYNRRWYEYTGKSAPEMEGWGWQCLHDPDVLPKVLERWKKSITSGEPFDMVFPLRGADGRFRPFLTRVNPLKNEAGQILHWFGTNTDITELREAREALTSSEERLRLALDAGRMGVWDWNIRTGELNWSDSLEPLHGLAPGTFGGTFDHFQQLIHPEDRETVNITIQQALETGGEFYVEFRNAQQNGGIRWIAGSGKVFPGDDGQPLRMIGVGLDVTKRKRAELTSRFLADASAALAVLVDFDSTIQKVSSLAVPAFADWATVDMLEADGSLRRVSVCHIDPAKVELAHEVHRRFPPDPAAPQGAWEILRTGRAEIVPEITDDLLVQSARDAELLGIMRELGLRLYIGVPLTIRGKTLGVITFISAESAYRYDNTDLAVAEDLASRAAIAIENAQLYRELREADHRKDEFLATLAHELRNPLAPIRNGLQIMRLSGDNVAAVEQVRSMMERQMSQMVRLVDDLLDVGRISGGKLELRKEQVDLALVVNNAVETSRPVIEAGGHALTIDMPPTPVVVDADVTRLGQVFANLLNNAAKYSDPGGQILITAKTLGGEVAVSVKDTGVGIPPTMLPKVFDLFSQVDRSLEKSQGGLGIGLTLVKRLVEMHGGSVKARSDGHGMGSEFVVRLPTVLTAMSEVKPPAAEEPLGSSTRRRVLVADDNVDSAETLGQLLELLGNEVRMANDGVQAAEVAAAFRPDVILLDIGMPRLNGYDACRRIREQPWDKQPLIISLTGWGQDEDRRRSREAGFDKHMVKPVDFAALKRLLAGL